MMAWLALGACTALALLLVHSGLRLRRQRRALCAALDEFADNNFQAVPLALREGELREVADACDRLLPKVQTTIAMLEWAARHDPMTDLLNSTSFRITVQSMLAANPGEGALLAIGVNELKRVNDSLGHTGGDQLLCAVADRLRMVASAGEGDTDTPIGEPVVARLGGNEFAIFLPGPVLRSNIEKLIQRLQRVVGEAVHIGAQSLRVKVSIGVAKVGYVGGQYDALLAAADAAMAQARAEGVGTYKFYTPAMRRALARLWPPLAHVDQRQPQTTLSRRTDPDAARLPRAVQPARAFAGNRDHRSGHHAQRGVFARPHRRPAPRWGQHRA
jgi:diguanylate cyclase (GGDEF)-like protein